MAGGRRKGRAGRIGRPNSVASASNAQPKPQPVEPIDESLYEDRLGAADNYVKYVLGRMEQYATRALAVVKYYNGRRIFLISEVGEERQLRDAEEWLLKLFDWGSSEDKAMNKALFEQILIRKLKEKEYFYCAFCDMTLFNYKQALIHFTRPNHRDSVQKNYDRAAQIYREQHGLRQRDLDSTHECQLESVLAAAGGLPERLAEEDARIEKWRHRTFGRVIRTQPHSLKPDEQFMRNLSMRYSIQLASPTDSADVPAMRAPRLRRGAPRADEGDDASWPPEDRPTASIVRHMQGDLGRSIMADLDAHLAREKMTWCSFCGLKTGNREGLYAHYTSYAHLKKIEEGAHVGRVPSRFEIQTTALNVQRRDLIE